MVRKTAIVFMSLLFLVTTSISIAGGPAAAPCAPISYPPKACGPGVGTSSAYWGDAPFPGLCGGIIALPFLVVGSLLGGNSMAPYPAAMPAGIGYGPQGPAPCGPISVPPKAFPAPCAPNPCGPPPACGPSGGGLFSGLPCLELCSSLFGNITGGAALY
jgi:hypothetical protein